MATYPFQLVRYGRDPDDDLRVQLANRPFAQADHSFQADARRFVPGEQLETAINTAIAIGEPLLVTGEPGTGKTQAAYYTAYKLGVEPVIHFQVKSDSAARDLLYHFDTVRYFGDAHLAGGRPGGTAPSRRDYIEPRALWHAFDRARAEGVPPVLLIDEIDKAPRDFPNDLLHELDKMEFTVVETGETHGAPRHLRPIVFITSNSERRLPEPFLRRCVYHHIRFDEELVHQVVASRGAELRGLDEGMIAVALERFVELRRRRPRKLPATDELLVWLRVLALAVETDPEQLRARLDGDLAHLPYLGVLLKDRQDLEDVRGKA